MGYKAKFDQTRTFGIELEFFGVNKFRLQDTLTKCSVQSKIGSLKLPSTEFWHISRDGSIEGKDGIELRSPILRGAEGLTEVRKVMTHLNYLEPKINSSCGLHVHWSSTDYTGKNILALLRLYAKFESCIDGLVALDRRGNKNRYCRSLVRDATLSWISDLNKKEASRAFEIALKFDENFNTLGSRNHKVNITSYLQLGTVEFRHHESTLDIDEVINWLVLTQQFVSRAKLASVSKEISSKPVLGELLRVLGMANYQCSGDALVEQSREWVKSKYSSVRRKKSVVTGRIFQNATG